MSTDVITVIDRSRIDQINAEYRLVRRNAEDAIAHAIACGEMLQAVKAELGHGNWLPWLDDHFDGDASTATLWMRMAANRERIPDFLGVRDAKQRLAKPRAGSREAIEAVSTISDADDELAAIESRLDGAHDRLRSEGFWTEVHSRHRSDIIELLGQAAADLDAASASGLSPHAVANLLRQAEIRCRQANARAGNLALQFERMR